jgi:hypothetical protein
MRLPMRKVVIRSVLVILLLPSCSGGGVRDPALEQTARDIVAMVKGYNCDLLPQYLPSGAVERLSVDIDAPLLGGMGDPIERLCFVLGRAGYPRSETMDVAARVETEERALLVLSGNGSGPTELWVVRATTGWKIDPTWALKRVQDFAAQVDLLNFGSLQEWYYSVRKTFTDDAGSMREVTSMIVEFSVGMARSWSAEGTVFAALGSGGQSVCGSTRSRSGELFMLRASPRGATFARGSSLPSSCPDGRLDSSW